MPRRRSARRPRLFGRSRGSRRRRSSVRRAIRIYTDPLQHACIAAAVAAPLVPRTGRGVLVSAVVPALVIDVDHAVAARSLRVRATTSLPMRPRSHSLVTALGTGAAVAAAAGPVHGWAAFGGLASHLLHDAGDSAAPTPVLWPFARARQLGRARQAAGTAALVLLSAAVSRATAAPCRGPSAACAGGGGA
jgi:LexA-binding, inner membrane-associated putative hydrolase